MSSKKKILKYNICHFNGFAVVGHSFLLFSHCIEFFVILSSF